MSAAQTVRDVLRSPVTTTMGPDDGDDEAAPAQTGSLLLETTDLFLLESGDQLLLG